MNNKKKSMETPKEKVDAFLVEYIKKAGVTLRANELKDFQLEGDEDESAIEEMANDYLSDLATEKAEYQAHLRAMGACDDSPSLDMDLQY